MHTTHSKLSSYRLCYVCRDVCACLSPLPYQLSGRTLLTINETTLNTYSRFVGFASGSAWLVVCHIESFGQDTSFRLHMCMCSV